MKSLFFLMLALAFAPLLHAQKAAKLTEYTLTFDKKISSVKNPALQGTSQTFTAELLAKDKQGPRVFYGYDAADGMKVVKEATMEGTNVSRVYSITTYYIDPKQLTDENLTMKVDEELGTTMYTVSVDISIKNVHSSLSSTEDKETEAMFEFFVFLTEADAQNFINFLRR